MNALMIIGLVIVGVILIVVVAGIVAGVLFCGDIMSYTDSGGKILSPAGTPAGKALVVYNPGVSGAAKNAAAAIAGDLQSKGYTVNLAGIKSAAAADISGYDVVIAGGPMYFGRVSNSVDSYLKALKPQKNVAVGVFGTTGSSQFHDEDIATFGEQVTTDLSSVTLDKKAATKTIRSGDAGNADCMDLISAVLQIGKIDMSMLYAFKPQKDRALHSVSRILRKAGVTPNMVTAAGLLMSVIAGLIAMSGHLYAGIFLFMLGACLDAVDGSFARACGLSSEFGRYFDSICDRLSELVFITGAVIGGAPVSAFAVIAGSLALMASRVYNHRKGLDSNAAMFGRPERLALLVVGLLAPAPLGTAMFFITGALCLVSSTQVLASGLRAVNE